MTSPIFLDSNVIIYAVTTGEFREAAQRVLQVARSFSGRFFVSTDILQEVLHHLRRRGHGAEAVGVIDDLLEAFAGSIEAVEPPDVLRAAEMGAGLPISTRDLVHLAVMERRGCTTIVSADGDFDRVPGVVRLDPRRVEAWAGTLGER